MENRKDIMEKIEQKTNEINHCVSILSCYVKSLNYLIVHLKSLIKEANEKPSKHSLEV
jgi:hypothetical protein